MKLKQLFDDETGVSPVIGVILMVAITVILAAVIGTFVLDLGNNSVQQNPQAGVSVDGSEVTVTSLGPNTAGVYCAGDSTHNSASNTAGVGTTLNCNSNDAVIAVHNNGNEAVIQKL